VIAKGNLTSVSDVRHVKTVNHERE
jgi:hypothetical protein